MYTMFLTLNATKQKKIINGAMAEFSKSGYKNASTNHIVANADISKGSLFHYFGSKKKLAEFLIQYSLDMFTEKIGNNMENMTDDIIERWKNIVFLKLKLISEHPLIFEFMFRMLNEDASDIKDYLQDSRTEFIEKFKNKVYTGVDYSKFRDDVDVGKTLKLIDWTLEGYAKEVQGQIADCKIPEELIDQSLQECNVYLDMLKSAFYR